ncbi:MAG: pyridoxal 5'-phosphate synthase glutaminase subunit PdxT [Thermoanaerobaculum sp.]|nr:pyridoxal 5'-phosphate synthase glutaminase subunit PdxT [Thermoanaerobaculum sp.]MDW7966895.1 pyridoxal 5'-phosphate synthase glutaminase subunit PdxT [Thermoanaerobaculum sp.]
MGVLALQGDFSAHRQALAERGLVSCEVRKPQHLEGLTGLVLPGGESTTMLKLLDAFGLQQPLVEAITAGLPVLATCAGIILLAEEVRHPSQPSLGLLRVAVERNAYGRQLASTVAQLQVTDELPTPSLEGVFIRAPRVVRVGEGVKVLATRGEDPVLVRQGAILAATFHPELSPASPVVALFADMVRRKS